MSYKEDRKINYRQLQAIAKKMSLPGNLKYHLLLEIIEARKEGNEYIVERILKEQKMERVRRKAEKLGAREAAYEHLRMLQDRKPVSRERKTQNNEIVRKPVGRPSWSSQNSSPDNYIRSLLSMPSKSFQELIKQSKEQELARAREARYQRPYFYNQMTENMVQQRMVVAEPNLVQQDPLHTFISPPSIRDYTFNNFMDHYESKPAIFPCCSKNPNILDNSFQYDQRNQREQSISSYQMVGENDVSWQLPPYEQETYCAEVGEPGGELVEDALLQHYSPYLTAPDYWKSVYLEQQRGYLDTSATLNPNPSSSTSIYEVSSSPNSDTLSATDEDHFREQQEVVFPFHNNNNHAAYSLPYNYLSADLQPSTVEYQEESLIQDMSGCPSIQETSLQEQYIPMDRDVCLLSVVDQEWTCEFSTTQSNYIHSVSSHSYLQLN